MKKTLSIILALVMACTMIVSVIAAEGGDVDAGTGTGSATQDVTAKFQSGNNVADEVYYVTVAWNVSGDLKYTEGDTTYTWNTTDLTYDEGATAAGTWSGSASVEVTVTNKSNDEITASAAWANEGTIVANCDFGTAQSVDVTSAAEGVEPGDSTNGTEQTGTISATVSVTSGSISADDEKIGTITVTIAPKAAD